MTPAPVLSICLTVGEGDSAEGAAGNTFRHAQGPPHTFSTSGLLCSGQGCRCRRWYCAAIAGSSPSHSDMQHRATMQECSGHCQTESLRGSGIVFSGDRGEQRQVTERGPCSHADPWKGTGPWRLWWARYCLQRLSQAQHWFLGTGEPCSTPYAPFLL